MTRKGFDYWVKARAYPSVISLIPFVVLINLILNFDSSGMLQKLGEQKFLAAISIPAVLFFFLAQFNRIIGKEIFEKNLFNSDLKFPTTELLLHSNHSLSEEYKSKIHEKIEHELNLSLLTKEEEGANNLAARKKIAECIGLVRRKVGDSDLLFQHNTEYGFVRNLVGGSVFGIVISIIDIIVSLRYEFPKMVVGVSILLCAFFLLTLIASPILLQRYGSLYAKQLFQEFLHSTDQKQIQSQKKE